MGAQANPIVQKRGLKGKRRKEFSSLIFNNGTCGTGVDSLIHATCARIGSVLDHALPIGIHLKYIRANLNTEFTTDAEFFVHFKSHGVSPPSSQIQTERIITNHAHFFYKPEVILFPASTVKFSPPGNSRGSATLPFKANEDTVANPSNHGVGSSCDGKSKRELFFPTILLWLSTPFSPEGGQGLPHQGQSSAYFVKDNLFHLLPKFCILGCYSSNVLDIDHDSIRQGEGVSQASFGEWYSVVEPKDKSLIAFCSLLDDKLHILELLP